MRWVNDRATLNLGNIYMQSYKISCCALVTFALIGCASQSTKNSSTLIAEVTEYGLYERGVERIYADPNSLSGQSRGSTGYKLKLTTQNVPLVIGTSFGFCYKITGYPKGVKPEITIKGAHPPFSRPGETPKNQHDFVRNLQPVNGIRSDCSGYGFDHPYELVAGNWIFTVVVDGRSVLSQAFLVE
jgi:hypothetical protein